MPVPPVYDSIDAAKLPADTQRALVYIDGQWVTEAAVRARFPTAVLYRLTTALDLDAQGIDIEPGNANAAAGAMWCVAKVARGERPGVYCSRVGVPDYGWPWCQSAVQAAGLTVADIDWLIADATGYPHLVPGSALTQWGQGPAGAYDISATDETFMQIEREAGPMIQAVLVNGEVQLYYIGTDGHVIQAVFDTTNGWVPHDLTAGSHLPVAAL